MDARKEIRRDIFVLALPIIAESIFQMSSGLVSSAFIGRLNESLISAQGIGVRITVLMMALFRGVGVGTTILVSRAYGAGERDECRGLSADLHRIGFVFAFLVSAAVWLNADRILHFFTDDMEVLTEAKRYLGILLLGMPAFMAMTVNASSFQGQNDARTPMFIAVFVNGLNIFLNYLLVFGKWGFPRLEVQGSGIATIFSQWVGTALGFFLLHRKHWMGDLRRHLQWHRVKEVFRIGIPTAFEDIFWCLSAIVMSKIVLVYGKSAFSAYQLGIQAESVTEMPAIGLGVAATALTARAVGLGDPELFKSYVHELRKTVFRINIFFSLLLLLAPRAMMRIFTDKPNLIEIGARYVQCMGLILIPQNINKIYRGALRSTGYAKISMLISGVGIWMVRIPLSLLVAYVLKWRIEAVWMALVLDQVTKFSVASLFYRNKVEKTLEECVEKK